MSDRIVRPTFSTARGVIAPARDENTKFMVAIALAAVAALYVAAYYVGAWVLGFN